MGKPGKSGSELLLSPSQLYIVKFISRAESKTLRRALPYLLNYMHSNTESLLAPPLALWRVKMETPRSQQSVIYVIVAPAVQLAHRKPHAVYDLKGSTLDRMAKGDETILKDLDLPKVSNGSIATLESFC